MKQPLLYLLLLLLVYTNNLYSQVDINCGFGMVIINVDKEPTPNGENFSPNFKVHITLKNCTYSFWRSYDSSKDDYDIYMPYPLGVPNGYFYVEFYDSQGQKIDYYDLYFSVIEEQEDNIIEVGHGFSIEFGHPDPIDFLPFTATQLCKGDTPPLSFYWNNPNETADIMIAYAPDDAKADDDLEWFLLDTSKDGSTKYEDYDLFEQFIKETFIDKSLFDDQFKIKIKYLDFESVPKTLEKYHYNYPLDDDSRIPYVSNNLLEGGEQLQEQRPFYLYVSMHEGDRLSVTSYFYPSVNGIIEYDNDYNGVAVLNPEIGPYPLNGPYRLKFDRKNYCPVFRYVFVPEVEYHNVNNSDDFFFWYEQEDPRNTVSLNFKYPQDNTEFYNFTYPNDNLTPFTQIIGPTEETDDENPKITVLNPVNYNVTKDLDYHKSKFDVVSDKSLFKITVNVSSKTDDSKKFIPIDIYLKDLKAYPIIESEGEPSLEQPECHDSPAIFTFPKFKGGLGLENEDNNYVYYYTISGKNKEGGAIIESGTFKKGDKSIELNTEITDFTVKIIDSSGNNDTENNNTDNEDTGIDERSFSFDDKVFYVTRPGPLSISISSTNPLCVDDSNGIITVTPTSLSYPNAEDNYYKWSVYKDSSEDPLELSDIKGPKAEGLPEGSYQVEFKNHLCLISSSIITLEDPPLLKITDPTVSHVICNGYSTGKIESSVDGGTPFEKPSVPYHYHWAQQKPIVDPWNSEPSTSSLYNLPAGYYKLTVTDAHDCQDSTGWIEISQPDPLDNSLTPEYIICKGGELAIDDGKENPRLFTKYEWIQPDGTIKQGRPIVVDSTMPQGQYILKSINDDNCYTLDTTLITFAENDLPVKFLVPSESFLADTLVIAEDSEIDADFNWYYEYNSEMFKDITEQLADRNKNQTYLWVERSGSDTITMYAENGFCKVSLSKAVTIINDFRPEGYDYTIAAAGIFSRLQIGPNPNNGEFTLFANLTEESELDVSLYDVSRSRRIPLDFSKYKTPSDRYQIPFQGLGLRTGIYTLLVSANGETKQIKFVVE